MSDESTQPETAGTEPTSTEEPLAPEGFESALEELEGLVERLEQGDQGLDAALRDFERGIRLSRQCEQALKAAEQRVATITGEGEDNAGGEGSDDDTALPF
ncbi:MAG: exodeoxyribonuclease VII small subunit [Pseudomonadota bacterium]